MAFEGDVRSIPQIPHDDDVALHRRTPARGRGDVRGRFGHRAMADHVHAGLRLGVPDAGGSVRADGQETASIGREAHPGDLVAMAVEDEERLARRGVPDTRRAIAAAGGYEIAARIERDRGDEARVPD